MRERKRKKKIIDYLRSGFAYKDSKTDPIVYWIPANCLFLYAANANLFKKLCNKESTKNEECAKFDGALQQTSVMLI